MTKTKPEGRIVAAYDYDDEVGNLLYQVVRLEPKNFRQRRPDGTGEWIWNMNGVKRVPYRLPGLLEGVKEGDTIFIVEGEKDVETLVNLGFVATCNPGGAKKWQDDFNRYFVGADVVVIPDNDAVGRSHARKIAGALRQVAKSIKLLQLTGLTKKGQDVSDWVAQGHTAKELTTLANETPPYSDFAAEIDAIRTSTSIGHKFAVRRKIAEVVYERLMSSGRFVRTRGKELLYFWTERRRLLTVLDEGEFAALLTLRFGLNSTEVEFRFTVSHLQAEILVNAPLVDVHYVSFYEKMKQLLFVDLGEGRMARLDGERIDIIDNGLDDVLFRDETESVSPEMDSPAEVRTALFSDISHDDDSGNSGEQEVILWAWFRSLFFPELLPTRPILGTIGPKGSGKGLTIKRIRTLLYGLNKAQLDAVSSAEEFQVRAINTHLFCIDNVDESVPWLNDELAKVATGISYVRRILYTTAQTAEYPARCFLVITSRTPDFRREDVVERLLLIFLASRPEKMAERILLGHISDKRATLWGNLLEELNSCVRHIRSKPMPQVSTQRLADWATLALHLAEKDGERSTLEAAFLAMERKREAFTIEENALGPYVDFLADGKWKTAQEIWDFLNAAGARDIRSPKAVAKLIRDCQEAARVVWGLEIRRDTHTRISSYRFSKPVSKEKSS